jgi:hypothetical protein
MAISTLKRYKTHSLKCHKTALIKPHSIVSLSGTLGLRQPFLSAFSHTATTEKHYAPTINNSHLNTAGTVG